MSEQGMCRNGAPHYCPNCDNTFVDHSAELTTLRAEQESARTVYANIEAWLSEHAVKVETHDWAHFKQSLAYGFRSYAKYLASLAKGEPPFIKKMDERRQLQREVAALRAEQAQLEQDATEDVVAHWFLQGGKAQFGELDYNGRKPQNADELVSCILSAVRAEQARLKELQEKWRKRADDLRSALHREVTRDDRIAARAVTECADELATLTDAPGDGQ
jgi:hypothetical protein